MISVNFIHLLSTATLLVFCCSTASSQMFGRSAVPQHYFQPVAAPDVVFRAQSEGVPLPPEAAQQFAQPTPGVVSPETFSAPSITPYSGAYGSSAVVPAGGFVPDGSSFFGSPQTVNGAAAMPVTPDASTWNAFSPPIGPDPFLSGGPQPYAPYDIGSYGGAAGLSGGYSSYGANGPTPYRQGWHSDMDIEWMPEVGTHGNASASFEQVGVNYDLGYTGPFLPGWVFTWTNQFRLRNWDGPQGGPGLPGSAFRLGMDFEMATSQPGPINFKMGITPSINTDFENSLGAEAFQLDGRGMFIFQLNQYWSMVLGAAYWDRVQDRILPYAGVIYRDDFWECRIMYPETTISLFLGNEAMWSKWMYVRAEYHVEAYEIGTAGGGSDQVELEDYRLMGGFRMDAGLYSWVTEAGWIFDRNVDYGLSGNGSFNPNNGFMMRMGWKY
ncbi:MAG: hypothetical protein R3C49_16310 [Planctomycetaceae bacterium]